jgi:hypothetical protein
VGQRGPGKIRGLYFFFCGKGNESCQLGTAFFVQHKIESAVSEQSLLVMGLAVHTPSMEPFFHNFSDRHVKRVCTPSTEL